MCKVECYVDSSWSDIDTRVASAYIVFENNRKVAEFSKSRWKIDGITEEQMVICPLLSYLRRYNNFSDVGVVIYTDNTSVISFINELKYDSKKSISKNPHFANCKTIFNNIKFNISCKQIPRELNKEADYLAKKCYNNFYSKHYRGGIVQFAIDDLGVVKRRWLEMFANNKYEDVSIMMKTIDNAIETLQMVNNSRQHNQYLN